MKILLIEDEEALSEVAAIQLRNLGNTVYTVSNLEEATRFLEEPEDALDLIIADHRLPDGRGIDFIIERVRDGCTIPTVVVSGCLTVADVAVLERAGIPYYRKPVIYSEVVRRFEPPRGPPLPPKKGEVPEIRLEDTARRRGLFGGFFRRG